MCYGNRNRSTNATLGQYFYSNFTFEAHGVCQSFRYFTDKYSDYLLNKIDTKIERTTIGIDVATEIPTIFNDDNP